MFSKKTSAVINKRTQKKWLEIFVDLDNPDGQRVEWLFVWFIFVGGYGLFILALIMLDEYSLLPDLMMDILGVIAFIITLVFGPFLIMFIRGIYKALTKVGVICLVFLLLCVMSLPVPANQPDEQCLTVKNLKGWAIKESNAYSIEEDGFSIDTFYLNFGDDENNKGWMTNEWGGTKIPCQNIGMLVCVSNNFATQILTWSIDKANSTVIHSRHIDGDIFGGAMMMTGQIVGKCPPD